MGILLSNLPVTDLNPENDYLDLIKKGNAIKFFFDNNFPNINNFKMLALYGEWGSGKTSLMHYLKSKLDEEYNVIIFEAWKYEKDGNLAVSLIDFLLNTSDSSIQEDFKDLGNQATKFLIGMAKGISFNFPGVSIQANEIFNELDKVDNKKIILEESQFKIQTEFENLFKEFEKRISKEKINLIFIDDLDRCEPENVLNLLSAIKLFFTLGEKTVYMAGVDKEAVKKAVLTKYNDIIKSEEYLEKIFDYSFAMPKEFSLYKLLNLYFDETITPEISENNHVQLIADFFKSIQFTNPRHIKKVLNKYEILTQYKYISKIQSKTDNSIPSLLHNKEGSIIETIFTLFFIVLYEYKTESYNEIKDFEKRNRNIIEKHYAAKKDGASYNLANAISEIRPLHDLNLWDSNFSLISINFTEHTTDNHKIDYNDNFKRQLFSLFAPSDCNIVPKSDSKSLYTNFQGSQHQILYFFIKYITFNPKLFRCPNKTTFIFKNLFNMCETWL